jgi:glucose/arabinose dehydrogenase
VSAAVVCGALVGLTIAHGLDTTVHRSPTKTHRAKRTARAASNPRFQARVSVNLSVPAINSDAALNAARALTVPHGWKVEVWARIPGARFMVWTPQHTLLVSTFAGTIFQLKPRADRSLPPWQQPLVTGLTQPQGLAFDTIHGQTVLYVAESDEIDRYVWRGWAGVGKRTVIVRNLPDLDTRGDDVHRTKSLVVGPNHRIYINIGSAFNASTIDVKGNPPRASVVSYGPDGGHMRVIATGVRNGEGLSFAPNGVLWGAINERDQIPYPFHQSPAGVAPAYGQVIPAYVDDHPSDEVVALTPGRNVGWPYCDPAPNLSMANLGFDDDVQNNPGGSRMNCARVTPINRGLPAHSAPLGFHFLEGSSLPASFTHGAILAIHGSWDREPPRPPAVLWMPWVSSRHTLGAPVTLISGFQLPDGSRWGRPADAVPGPDGDLYVSDDTAGAVYRITP